MCLQDRVYICYFLSQPIANNNKSGKVHFQLFTGQKNATVGIYDKVFAGRLQKQSAKIYSPLLPRFISPSLASDVLSFLYLCFLS